MKTLEVLFPEFCHIYAESFNAEILAKCCPEIELVSTSNREKPLFIQGKADMVYIGCASEAKQEMILERLAPYREEIAAAIEAGVIVLATGNALELFGAYIEDGDRKIPALDIFKIYAKRLPGGERHNSQFIADFEGMSVLGHKSQFSFAYPLEGETWPAFLTIRKGVGMNPDTNLEGIHYRNFFGTHSVGPFLVLNPDFTKYLLRLMDLPDTLCFEKEYYEAARYRLEKLETALH